MGRRKRSSDSPSEPVLSVIGQGMVVAGDVATPGSLRVEGRIDGRVWAGKAVVVGRGGAVVGQVATRDAVVGGEIRGILHASSRLEVQAGAVLEGEIRTPRLQLEEGAHLEGDVRMADLSLPEPPEWVEDLPAVGAGTERGDVPPAE